MNLPSSLARSHGSHSLPEYLTSTHTYHNCHQRHKKDEAPNITRKAEDHKTTESKNRGSISTAITSTGNLPVKARPSFWKCTVSVYP
jgi:hypothetical protein